MASLFNGTGFFDLPLPLSPSNLKTNNFILLAIAVARYKSWRRDRRSFIFIRPDSHIVDVHVSVSIREFLFELYFSAVLNWSVSVRGVPFYLAIKVMAATQIKPSTNMTGPVPGHGWPRRGGGPAQQTPTQFNESKYPATSAMTINRPINLWVKYRHNPPSKLVLTIIIKQ